MSNCLNERGDNTVGLWFGGSRRKTSTITPEEYVARAQVGHEEAREELIGNYSPFILKVASRVAGRYLVPGNDEEASVALIAFNEAIDSFDGNRYGNFLGFSSTVIRRRLIDFYRGPSNADKEVPLTAFDVDDDEGNVVNLVELQQAQRQYSLDNEAAERRHEITAYSQRLSEYQINFSELVDIAPKHTDARNRAANAARMLAEDERLSQYVRERGQLPLKELSKLVAVSRKTLERHRKYIIAIWLIYAEDLTHLKEYLTPVE